MLKLPVYHNLFDDEAHSRETLQVCFVSPHCILVDFVHSVNQTN